MSVHGLVDCYLHTSASIDAQTTGEEHCARASALGWAEIATTNHTNLRTEEYHLPPEVLAEAWDDIRRSRRAHPDIIVRIGIEVDCFEDQKEDIAGELPGYAKAIGRPLDFIKGSAHEMDGVRFASKKQAHELLDDSDSARSVYVGDRPSWAVVGAARAGFEMPALIDGTRGEVTEPKDEYPAPDDAIRSLFDLLDIL